MNHGLTASEVVTTEETAARLMEALAVRWPTCVRKGERSNLPSTLKIAFVLIDVTPGPWAYPLFCPPPLDLLAPARIRYTVASLGKPKKEVLLRNFRKTLA